MKRLVIVRHAHRDTSKGRELDNGLDALGKRQRKDLTRHFLKKFSHARAEIYSSPTRRCRQTVEKISQRMKIGIELVPELMEKGEIGKKESERNFRQRIRKFLTKVRRSKKDVVVLSCHGDWIPEALEHLIGCDLELKKGGWAEIEFKKSKTELQSLIQSFR